MTWSPTAEDTMTDVSGLRPRLTSIAYRILGTVADPEDAVQDAFPRYQTVGGCPRGRTSSSGGGRPRSSNTNHARS